MIEIKRNCSSSIMDNGDLMSFGDFTIRFTGDHYIMFMETMNELKKDPQSTLAEIISRGLE